MLPSVSAIVLNYRTPAETERCVTALLRQTLQPLEVILVDNASCDDSRGRLAVLRQRFPDRIRFIETPRNVGYSRGNDLGIRFAQGTYLLIVNPDTEIEPAALLTMVRFLEEHPEVGIVGPQLREPHGTIRDSYRTFPTPLDLIIKRTPLKAVFRKRMRSYLQWNQDPHLTRRVDWLVGACMLLRRDFYKEIGGFDPRFFLFLEDTDLCRRCWEAGKRVVYLPEARALDTHRRLSAGGTFSLFTKRTVRTHILSAVKYFIKWWGKPLPVCTRST